MELNVDTLNLTSRCARCNALYYERDNVGSWHCAQHPGRWNGDMSGYKYSKGHWDCCGYSGVPYDKSFERGCQPADHRSEATPRILSTTTFASIGTRIIVFVKYNQRLLNQTQKLASMCL